MKNKGEQLFSYKGLGVEILKESDRLLSANEIWNKASDLGLLESLASNSKTPFDSFTAMLYLDCKKENNIFVGDNSKPKLFSLKNKHIASNNENLIKKKYQTRKSRKEKNKLSYLEFAEVILIENRNIEMSAEEMWNFAEKNDLISDLAFSGKTPFKSFNARLYTNVKRDDSNFITIGTRPIKFILKRMKRFVKDYNDENILNDIYNLKSNQVKNELAVEIHEPIAEYIVEQNDITDDLLDILFDEDTVIDTKEKEDDNNDNLLEMFLI